MFVGKKKMKVPLDSRPTRGHGRLTQTPLLLGIIPVRGFARLS